MKGQHTIESNEVGEYAEITNYPVVKGLIGKISRVFETTYPNFENGIFYEITAENYGPYIAGTKYRTWMPGNREYVKEGQFRFV